MAVSGIKAQSTAVPASVFLADEGSASLRLKNKGAAAIFLGGPDVTAATAHYELGVGEVLPWDMQHLDDLWAVSAAPQELDILVSSA